MSNLVETHHARTPPNRGTSRRLTWQTSTEPIDYPDALAAMQTWSDAVANGTGPEQIWLLQHPSLYTAGTSARKGHLLEPDRLPVFRSGRGGEYTYHGPGQRVLYAILDVRRRFGGDVRAYVTALEDWTIAALSRLGVSGQRGDGQIGVWVKPVSANARPGKIASIGVRIRNGVSLHGIAINVAPNLEHFSGIIACGGAGELQTSLEKLGVAAGLDDVDEAFKATFADVMHKR